MLSYLVQRLLMAVGTLIVVSIVAFTIIQMPPGDYVDAYKGLLESMGEIVTEDRAYALRLQYGLFDPMYVQYLRWLGGILTGNFGLSMEYNRPVAQVIGDRLWLTVIVALASVAFVWLMALPIGIYSAVRQYSFADYAFTFIGFLGLAIPHFLLALIVMYCSFRYFDANVGGLFSTEYVEAPWSIARVIDLLGNIWIPALILGTSGTAALIRVMRANLLDELRKPYVVAARARGLSEWQLILKYPVRVALNPFASTVGYILPYIVSGSIIVSVVLSLPTVGPLLLRALLAQDMYLAGTIIMLLGVMTVIGTLISDLLLAWIDPRIRLVGQK
ncbi:ABC transporter permease [Bradyrhizobium sp. BR 1432]|uniref:ABC transporter permease n=1 Tax=Bradyrhizobium sp. BR 1432 TaxID=3447966 RepID=UPI003EE7E3D6